MYLSGINSRNIPVLNRSKNQRWGAPPDFGQSREGRPHSSSRSPVGMPSWTLRVASGPGRADRERTRSVQDGIPTRSMGTSGAVVSQVQNREGHPQRYVAGVPFSEPRFAEGRGPGLRSTATHATLLIALFVSMQGAFASFASEPLRVVVRVPAGTHYVGQAIEVRVEVEGASGRPDIEAPRSAVADVRALSRDESRPMLSRFLVIPRQAGPMEIPPFRARSGDRSGTSKPTRLTITSLPAEGRTSAFLGGVGSFELRAEAEPTRLRPGQTLEYRVRVTGPAAWGSVRGPDPNGWSSLAPAFRVEPLPDILEGVDPPVRTFRYRLRPSKSGRAVLPPVAVAAFDPTTRRYATKATAGVPIRVEEPPRFDPSRFDYLPLGKLPPDARLGFHAIGFGLGLGLLATLGSALWSYSKRKRTARRSDPRMLALEQARGLVEAGDRFEAARAITEAFATFLQRVDGRGPGVLTPPEARKGIERLTRDPELARRAEKLIGRCDRASYGDGVGSGSSLIAEGRDVFEGIAGAVARKEGPREAVETA